MTRYKLYHEYIKPLDPEVNMARFYQWFAKTDNAETNKSVRNLIETTFLKDTQNLSMDERANLITKMQGEIRLFAKKLFHSKIYSFIENPSLANKLTYEQLKSLYNLVRKEEDREREIDLKKNDSKRKDVFGLFAMFALAKQFSTEDIKKFRDLVKAREDVSIKVQPDSGPDSGGDSDGRETAVLGPSGSADNGEIQPDILR